MILKHIWISMIFYEMLEPCWHFKKSHLIFSINIRQKKIYKIAPSQVLNMTRGISLPSYVVIGWVVLTISCRQAFFLWMSQPWTWVKVLQEDLYFLCPTYLRFGSNSFDIRSKSNCGGRGRGGGKELKTLSHPRLGWLNEHVKQE